MHNPPLILIVDDKETNREILRARLRAQGYELLEAGDGEVALSIAQQQHPDLILLDVLMPKTAMVDSKDVVAGLEAGADEYLTKPVDQAALVARVRSMLRVKELTDQVRAQAAELASWNSTLEDRVARQLKQIERADRLRRFLPLQVADLLKQAKHI